MSNTTVSQIPDEISTRIAIEDAQSEIAHAASRNVPLSYGQETTQRIIAFATMRGDVYAARAWAISAALIRDAMQTSAERDVQRAVVAS